MTSTNSIRRVVSRSLATSAIVALSVGALTAQAQQQAQPSQPTEKLEEIVETGSLIKRTNAETAVPITILKADAL
ncbi:MAG TPA: hypothetical protein VH135_08360, partial [Steroidobacteraceae bacterium]|nr:hypothetical protein [Steroidobacteraceae bacterium]